MQPFSSLPLIQVGLLSVRSESMCTKYCLAAKVESVVTKLPSRYLIVICCPPVRGDNQRALASGLSYIQVDKHGITILYHLHQCRPCTSRDISC